MEYVQPGGVKTSLLRVPTNYGAYRGILSDYDIVVYNSEYGDLVTPFDVMRVQPASYDLTLGRMVYIPDEDRKTSWEQFGKLPPWQLVLGHTREVIKLPGNLAARFEGISSLGRMGLMTHVTAGFIDPGFEGELTLEILNVSGKPIEMSEGMRTGQIAFFAMNNPSHRPYGKRGHYQGQTGPTPVAEDNL